MNQPIQKLEIRVRDLIAAVGNIRRENEILRSDQRLLQQEYKSLQEKNRIAHGRVEQIMARLKSMQA